MVLFYPRGGGATMFTFPRGRKLRIVGCATKEDLDNPTEFDSEGERCFIVGKDGNSTDLTVGHYAGLVSFTLNDTGDWSRELGIYNSSLKKAKVFSARGDSGSPVWRAKEGEGYIVGHLHSGENKGGSTSKPRNILHPWLLPPGPDQEAVSERRFLPSDLANLKVLPLHPSVHIADDVAACALASRFTASSSVTSYPLFLSRLFSFHALIPPP